MAHTTTPLNPCGNQARWLHARAADADLARLARLAEQHGGNRSAVIREVLRLGLDALEREQPPP